jgi:hypothetical protein
VFYCILSFLPETSSFQTHLAKDIVFDIYLLFLPPSTLVCDWLQNCCGLHTFYGWWWPSLRLHYSNNHLGISYALFYSYLSKIHSHDSGHHLISGHLIFMDINLPSISSCLPRRLFFLTWNVHLTLLMPCYSGSSCVPRLSWCPARTSSLRTHSTKTCLEYFSLSVSSSGHLFSRMMFLPLHDNLVLFFASTCDVDPNTTCFFSCESVPALNWKHEHNTHFNVNLLSKHRHIPFSGQHTYLWRNMTFLFYSWLAFHFNENQKYFLSTAFDSVLSSLLESLSPCLLTELDITSHFFVAMSYSLSLTLFSTKAIKNEFYERTRAAGWNPFHDTVLIPSRSPSKVFSESGGRGPSSSSYPSFPSNAFGSNKSVKRSPKSEGNRQRSLHLSTSSSSTPHSLSFTLALSLMISFLIGFFISYKLE